MNLVARFTNKIRDITYAHPITHHIDLHDETQTVLFFFVINREIVDNYVRGMPKDKSIHCMDWENLPPNERKSVMARGTRKKMLEVMGKKKNLTS